MWSSPSAFAGLVRLGTGEKVYQAASPYKGIVYMSLDCGIAWNYLGGKYPTLQTWTWCVSDPKQITNYIDGLWANGLLPVFYTAGAKPDVIEKMVSYLKYDPPVFVSMPLEMVNPLITSSWSEGTKSVISSNPLLPKIGITVVDAPHLYRIGPKSSIGCLYTLENLGFDPLETFNVAEPQLLILVGQPGCGKSTIAGRLAERGWYVIDENKAASIRRASTSARSKIFSNFKDLIAGIGRPDTTMPGKLGVVIDCTNPQFQQRRIYASVAEAVGVKYIVGWVTRPGYYYNAEREHEIKEIALRTYAASLEQPSSAERAFRLV